MATDKIPVADKCFLHFLDHEFFHAPHIGDHRAWRKGIFDCRGHLRQPLDRKAEDGEIAVGGYFGGIGSSEIEESTLPHFLDGFGPTCPYPELGLRTALAQCHEEGSAHQARTENGNGRGQI